MERIIIIPARLASERLPSKLLLAETGQSLIQHTYDRCKAVEGVRRVIVASGDPQIRQAVEAFGGLVVDTDPDLPSGTDRVASAASSLGLADDCLIVNVQGDEPLIEPEHVNLLFELLESSSEAGVATLVSNSQCEDDFRNPNRVKVAVGSDHFALYFSRSPIPHARSVESAMPQRGWDCHLGIYGFRMQALRSFAEHEPTALEEIERLEQLRFLELGYRIKVASVKDAAAGIDTSEDYQKFVEAIGPART